MTAYTAYTVAQRRPGGPVHLSADGEWTLCHWLIRDNWQRHDKPEPMFVIWLSGVAVCKQCEREATSRREKTP